MSLSMQETINTSPVPNVEVLNVTFQPGMLLDDIERSVIMQTLRQMAYNRTHAARVLGIGIRTLQRKLKKYGVKGIGLKRAV